MTRHITDQPKPLDAAKRAAAFMRVRQTTIGRVAPSKWMGRPRPTGNGRLFQFTMIERGRKA